MGSWRSFRDVLPLQTGPSRFLDVRPLPRWGYGAGFIFIGVSFSLISWTLRVNKFNKPFAATVGFKQDGQCTIRDGPYSCVRHPFYASLLPANVAYPLALGSWLVASSHVADLPRGGVLARTVWRGVCRVPAPGAIQDVLGGVLSCLCVCVVQGVDAVCPSRQQSSMKAVKLIQAG